MFFLCNKSLIFKDIVLVQRWRIMKSKIKLIFELVSSKCLSAFKKIKESQQNYINRMTFEDLTPKDNIDEDGQYSNAITWALNNNKIKNIALTGPYGSGKSSILKTYQAKQNSKYKFLNISLASFKVGEDQNENVLEKSILQQMFYRVNDKTLPYSRFKKINNIKKTWLYFKVLLLIAFLISGLQLFNPTFLNTIFNKTFIKESLATGNQLEITLMSIMLLIFSLYFIHLIIIIFNFFGKNIKFSKFSFASATIEIDKGSENSIFDKYLDEILYFFEATKYNVVVFEDLDRFNNLGIFERLRELNSLINNAEKINRRVIFLYAIKDDMFGTEDDDMSSSRNRTKFFDFIIPVIPIINSSNSGQVFLDKIRNTSGGESVTEEFINDITIYIDDMRILINICNEFILYLKKLGGIDLIHNSLLAMIVYKNIYPKDFAELQFNKGMLYEVFQKKQTVINIKVKEIEEELSKVENDIIQAERDVSNSIEELKVVYADGLGLINYSNNTYVNLDGRQYNYQNWRNSDFFERLKDARNINCQPYNRGYSNPSIEQLATIFGTKKNYFERERIIKLKEENEIDSLKQRLEKLKKEKDEVLSWSLKDLISKGNFDTVFNEKTSDKKLLVFLIRNGYIDEMYQQYITYFYPGSITTEDMKFIMSVKDQEALPFTYTLSNKIEIIKRLHGNEFRRPEILNYDLIEFLIANNSNYSVYLDSLMSQLTNKSNKSISFIDDFKEITNFKNDFIRMIGREWPSFWKYIELESNYTKNKIDKYLSDIISFVNIEDIISMNLQGVLSNYISQKVDFLTLFPSEELHSKVKSLLIQLDVKFENLQYPINEQELFNFVYENNLYIINEDMITLIINYKTGEKKLPNYTNIFHSNLEPLKNYVNEQIQEYVENIYLNLQNNNENEETIIELLNRDDIALILKETIIEHLEQKISNIALVGSPLWEKLISDNKIVCNWNNIITYYTKTELLDGSLLGYLNIEKNSFDLSLDKLSNIKGFEQEILEDISYKIIESNEIENTSFANLVKSLTSFESIPIESLSRNRVELLVENNVLVLTTANFNALKINFEELALSLIEKNIEHFISNPKDFELSSKDLINLLNSSNIDENDKNNIIKTVNVELLTNDYTLAVTTAKLLINQKNKVDESMLNVLLDIKFPKNDKISLLAGQIKHLSNDTITLLLNKLGSPYSEIAENGKRPLLNNSETNMSLVHELDSKKFISTWKLEANKIRVNTKLK